MPPSMRRSTTFGIIVDEDKPLIRQFSSVPTPRQRDPRKNSWARSNSVVRVLVLSPFLIREVERAPRPSLRRKARRSYSKTLTMTR
jgi:hypothetical protein